MIVWVVRIVLKCMTAPYTNFTLKNNDVGPEIWVGHLPSLGIPYWLWSKNPKDPPQSV